jgi:hypothetical protein
MMTRLAIQSCLLGLLALVVGCDTRWRSDNYRLIAVDSPGQMMLTRDGTDSAVVGPTVFSIGSNEKYIVVAQHPGKGVADFDRSITNYFIVERTRSSSLTESQNGVRGPLSREEFDKLSATLSLPKFTKTFDDLK